MQACEPMQSDCGRMKPIPLRAASSGIKSVALLHMMSQFGLGCSRWSKQFITGFDVVGAFPQGGLFMPGEKMGKPDSPARPFPDASSRYETRSNASGWAHGETLWSEAIGQVEKERLGPPRRLISSDGPLFLGADRVNAAFRFSAIQRGKIRAFGNLKYGCVNMECATRTPISLPTWDHIGQICLYISTTDQPWSFFKADHKAAYGNLPLNGTGGCLLFDPPESIGRHLVWISPTGTSVWRSLGGPTL